MRARVAGERFRPVFRRAGTPAPSAREPRRRLAWLTLLATLAAGCTFMGGSAAPAPPPGAVIATIGAGPPPTYLAIHPSGAYVYAASDARLTVIRTADNSIVATLPINPNPTGMAVSPDGSRLYINTLFSVSLTILDTATNTLLAPRTMFLQRVRGGFGRMVVSPDGATIYVANTANRQFGIIDLVGNGSNVLRPTVFPVDLAITPDGRTVYYAGCKPICTPGFLQRFDTASGRFTQSVAIDGNPFRIALSPDASRAYAANLTGPSLSVVDLTTLQVTSTVPVPLQPTGLAVSRDGSAIYVASQTSGTLTVIDAASLSVRASAAITQAREVVLTPDDRRAYVSSGNQVVVLDTNALLGGPPAP